MRTFVAELQLLGQTEVEVHLVTFTGGHDLEQAVDGKHACGPAWRHERRLEFCFRFGYMQPAHLVIVVIFRGRIFNWRVECA